MYLSYMSKPLCIFLICPNLYVSFFLCSTHFIITHISFVSRIIAYAYHLQDCQIATSSIFINLLILVMIESPTSFLNSFSLQQVSVGMHDDSCRLRPNTDLSLYVQHLIAPILFDKMLCSSASFTARMTDFR